MRHNQLAVATLAVMVAACSASENPAAGGDAARAAAVEQVTQRMNDYIAMWRSNDLAKFDDFWTDDGQVFEPEIEAIGRAAFDKIVEQFKASYAVGSIDVTVRETVAYNDGDVVIQTGSVVETAQPKDSSQAAIPYRNSFLARWRKDNGVWRIDLIMATPMPKATGASN